MEPSLHPALLKPSRAGWGMLWAGFSRLFTLHVLGHVGGNRGAPGCGYGEEEPGNKDFLTVFPSSTAQPLVTAHLYGSYPTLGPVSILVRDGTWGKEGRGMVLITRDLGRGKITQRVTCSCGECPAWPRSRWHLCLIVVSILNLHHT